MLQTKSKYKIYDIKPISNKDNQNLPHYPIPRIKILKNFLDKNWTSAKNLFDEPIVPFISKFKPNFYLKKVLKSLLQVQEV